MVFHWVEFTAKKNNKKINKYIYIFFLKKRGKNTIFEIAPEPISESEYKDYIYWRADSRIHSMHSWSPDYFQSRNIIKKYSS